MYEYDYDMSPDELRHYGRKGMKWGQHIFGKVKNGVVTYAKKKSTERSERKAEEQRKRDIDALRKKPVRYLTEAEYKERTRLANQEKMLKMLEREVDNLSPQQKTSGENFAKKFMTEAVGRALIDGSKRALTDVFDKKMKSAFGIDGASDTLSALKKEADKLKLERDISDNKRRMTENEDFFSRRDKKSEESSSNKKSESQQKSKESDSSKKEKSKKSTDNDSDNKVYEGKVTGEGTSKSKHGGVKGEKWEKKKSSDYYDPIESDFVNRPASSVNRTSPVVAKGISYVERLLLSAPDDD